MTLDDVMHSLNVHLGEHGECPAMDDIPSRYSPSRSPSRYCAVLILWDEFNNPALVAKWMRDLGASEIAVSWTLYDDGNDIHNGREIDSGHRTWEVYFDWTGPLE